jgi:hypothetical protein
MAFTQAYRDRWNERKKEKVAPQLTQKKKDPPLT